MSNSSTTGNKLIWIGIGLGAVWWVLESFIHVYVFEDGALFQQLFSPDQHELWMRSLITAFLIIFSVYAQFIITQRRRAEEATSHAYAELNQIFETAADGMRVVDKDFNVVRCNQTFLTVLGISKSEAVGRKCYEVLSGPMCHTPECPLTRILRGEERVEFDIKKERPDGVTVPYIVTATPFVGPGGELIGIIENFKDITEREQAEVALRKAHGELEQRVQERTAELQRANKELRSEMAERKKAEKELQEKMHESERFNELAVGRELKMIEMKEEVNRLLAERGMEIKYEVPE